MTQSRRTDGFQRMGTVFLVDDNQGVRTALGRVFQSVGYEVHRFDSAQAYLENVFPDDSGCLVLDIKMPGMTGLDLQERLSTLGFTTPIIFMVKSRVVCKSERKLLDASVRLPWRPPSVREA